MDIASTEETTVNDMKSVEQQGASAFAVLMTLT